MLDVFNIDDATKDKFRELFLTVYDSCKYEVGEAAKAEYSNNNITIIIPEDSVSFEKMDERNRAFD